MEDNLQSWEDLEDNLSLCNFSLHGHDREELQIDREIPDSPNSDQDLFEFSTTTSDTSKPNPTPDDNNIVFCGRIMTPPQKQPTNYNLFDDQRNSVFPSTSATASSNNRTLQRRSNSFHVQSPKPGASSSPPPRATRSFRHVSSKSSSSSRINNQKVFIGLARIPARMELDDIKKRQSRRAPVPMFPAEAINVASCDDHGSGSGVGKSQRGKPGPFRCRGYLLSALAKASSGCIPIVGSHA